MDPNKMDKDSYHWNYRVLRQRGKLGSDNWFFMAEVHYEDGVPWGWSEANPAGEEIGGIAQDLVWMVEAMSRPVLDLNNDGTFKKGQR